MSGGHCDHCSWSCKNEILFQSYDHSSVDWKRGGEWDTGHCPACAAAKAEREDDAWHQCIKDAGHAGPHLYRGAHMEEE